MIVKVCGMRDSVNIRLVEQLPVQWMGFIFYPQSSRYVPAVPEYLPQHQKRIGVFVDAPKDFILEKASLFGLHMLQLHGNETPEECRQLRQEARIPLIKAFGIHEDTHFSHILEYEGIADYFLFDTFCTTKGGSGKTFDHQLLENYKGNTPFLLSGGLGLDNIDDIRNFHHPQWVGIDLNSRFETSPAVKSVGMLQTFLQQLHNNKEQDE